MRILKIIGVTLGMGLLFLTNLVVFAIASVLLVIYLIPEDWLDVDKH